RQILLNLLDNALKFTEHGRVTLRVEMQNAERRSQNEPPEPAAPPPGPAVRHSAFCMLHFAVSDTGPGIPPDELATVFAPFEQADPSPARHPGGIGLGLAIVGRLVRLMGGRVEVDSAPGRGSTFRLTLPTGRATRPAPPA